MVFILIFEQLKFILDLISSFVVDTIMWVISKCQITIKQLYQKFAYKKDGDIIIKVEFFNEDKNKKIEYLIFELLNSKTKGLKKVFSNFTNNNFVIEKSPAILDFYEVDYSIRNQIPNDYNFLKISNNYNKNIRIENAWKRLENILLIPKVVDFIYKPLLINISYSKNIDPMIIELTSANYNYLIVGNVLNKYFFEYFINRYFDNLLHNLNIDATTAYNLFVIDYNFEKKNFTEKDEFIIKEVNETKDGITTTSIKIFP
jgi:hypothetical protein